MNKKQFLLYTALAVVLSAGCTRLNMDEGEGEDDCGCGNAGEVILEFVTSIDGKKPGNSRAVLPDIDLLASGFTVAGYLTPGRVETCEADSVFPNVFDQGTDKEAVLQATANAGKFFLLLPQITIGSGNDTIPSWKKVSYFAWSQSGFEAGYGIVSSPKVKTDKGMPALGIHLPTAAANQGDIVVAAQTNLTNDYIVSSVNLDFRHILSKLTFKVKTAAGLKVSIKKSKLTFAANRLYSKATFQCDGSDTLGYYKRDSYLEALNGTITPTGWEKLEVNATTMPLGEMMLIPQAIRQGDIKLALTYTTFTGGIESTAPVTKEVALKNTDLRAGKNHLYTLSLSAEEMKVFNVVVDEWNQEEIIIDTNSPLVLETTSEGTLEAGVKSKIIINDALNNGWQLAVTTEWWDWLHISDASGTVQNPLPSGVGTTGNWYVYMDKNETLKKRNGTIILRSKEGNMLAFVDVIQKAAPFTCSSNTGGICKTIVTSGAVNLSAGVDWKLLPSDGVRYSFDGVNFSEELVGTGSMDLKIETRTVMAGSGIKRIGVLTWQEEGVSEKFELELPASRCR